MTETDELAATLLALKQAFGALNATWAVGGSLASAAYGEPRATNDIDVIAALDESQARRMAQLLGDDFYCSEDAAVDAVRRRDSFNVIDQRSFLKVDVFVPPAGPLGAGQLDRVRQLALVGPVSVPVLVPKTSCSRSSVGSERAARSRSANGATSSRSYGPAGSTIRTSTMSPRAPD
jgi:hypothetical protein